MIRPPSAPGRGPRDRPSASGARALRRARLIAGEADGILVLRVTPPPVEGRANEACLRLLATSLDLPVSRLRIVSGQHARLKTTRVVATSAQTICAKLFDLLERPRR